MILTNNKTTKLAVSYFNSHPNRVGKLVENAARKGGVKKGNFSRNFPQNNRKKIFLRLELARLAYNQSPERAAALFSIYRDQIYKEKGSAYRDLIYKRKIKLPDWYKLSHVERLTWSTIGMRKIVPDLLSFNLNIGNEEQAAIRDAKDKNKWFRDRLEEHKLDQQPFPLLTFGVEKNDSGMWHLHGSIAMDKSQFKKYWKYPFKLAAGEWSANNKQRQLVTRSIKPTFENLLCRTTYANLDASKAYICNPARRLGKELYDAARKAYNDGYC